MAVVTQNTNNRPTDYNKISQLMDIKFLPGDNNRSLRAKIINLWKYKENTTKQGLVNAISNALGLTTYNTITRRIFWLSRIPLPTTTFTVSVDYVTQVQVVEANYNTATTGYIVWLDNKGVYSRILEFINPPGYTRRTVSGIHSGTLVQIAYQYEVWDRDTNTYKVYNQLDKCNPYDPEDESYMGFSPEAEGSVGVYPLNDISWLEAPSNGMKLADGSPTSKLWNIFQEVDRSSPTTWGE